MSQPILEAYAKEHIRYEIQMLVATASEWSKFYSSGNWVVSNALHNSFAIHARNLDHFLSNKEGIKAKQYVADFQRWPLPVWREKVNRKVAHLKLDRRPGNDQANALDFQTILNEIGDGLLDFYNALPDNRKTWFAVIPELFQRQS